MSDSEWVVRAEDVSKKFGLTLRQSMRYGLRDMARRLLGRSGEEGNLRDGEFWAVKGVSFDLRPGEALGVMGVNGCGKTTLLRMLNGIYAPDRGRIKVRGRVGALIAAGAGFAPMLSGRENVYVNGALLGLSTHEIDALMDEIVAFAELGQFIDLPVKNYSSGMYVRLGFAVAALSRPDVLLMDEVLAVGDLNFQKKCYDYIRQLKEQGTAIILVSHSPGAIWSVCDRGLFMNRGELLVQGPVEDVIRAYEEQNTRNALSAAEQFDAAVQRHDDSGSGQAVSAEYGHNVGGNGDAVCTAVRVLDGQTGIETKEIEFGADFVLEYHYEVKQTIVQPILRSSLDAAHYRFIVSMDSYEQGYQWEALAPGRYVLRVRVQGQGLRPGMYRVNMSIASRVIGVHIFYWLAAASFVVRHPTDRFLYSNDQAVCYFPCSFSLEPAS